MENERNKNPMLVCERCLYAIEAHEGKQVTIRYEVDEENEQESRCDFCEESGFNTLIVIGKFIVD